MTLRALLLDMRDRKGWRALLGCASFEEYGKAELQYEKAHLHRLANAAEIARSLESPMGDNAPERHLRPLAPLADEERRQVWEEATAKAEAEGETPGARRPFFRRRQPVDHARSFRAHPAASDRIAHSADQAP